MQTSANVCPRHEMRRGHVKDQPARRVSPPAPLHSDLPNGLSDRDCGSRRLQLNRYLADLAGELEGHSVRPGHGLTFAYTHISALVRRKRHWAVSGHLCRCGLLRCDESDRQPSNSYLERVREFPELG